MPGKIRNKDAGGESAGKNMGKHDYNLQVLLHVTVGCFDDDDGTTK